MLLRALFSVLCLVVAPLSLSATPAQVIVVGQTAAEEGSADTLSNVLATLQTQGLTAPDVIFTTRGVLPNQQSGKNGNQSNASGNTQQPVFVIRSGKVNRLVTRVLNQPAADGKNVLVIWDAANVPDVITAFGYAAPSCSGDACAASTYVLTTFPGTGAAPEVIAD